MQPYVLSLDLSTKVGTLALHKLSLTQTTDFITEATVSTGGDHSEQLIPTLHRTLDSTGISLNEVGKLITSRGPGSFTGLRIGLATLKAFALSRNLPIVTVHGSEARALGWRQDRHSVQRVSVITQVAAQRYLWSQFSFHPHCQLEGEKILEESELSILSIAENEILLTDENPPAYLVQRKIKTEAFPLRARHLAENYLECSTKKEYGNLQEWIELSPDYFGEKAFGSAT